MSDTSATPPILLLGSEDEYGHDPYGRDPNHHGGQVRSAAETIILRAEGGRWMHIGTEAGRGITHEGLSLSADRAGPSTCSFTLRRDPRVSWPDLSPFNECIVEIAGVRVWSGRMREAPGQSGASNTIAFTGSGWQAHLDDDLMAYGWVHARLSDWRDWLSFPDMANVSIAPAGLIAAADGGELRIGWPDGSTLKSNTAAGVMLDLGEHHPRAIRVAIQVSMTTINGWTQIYVRGGDTANMLGSGLSDYVSGFGSGGLTAATKTWMSGTVATGRRYVSVFLYRPALGDVAATAEHVLRIHRILVFADAADEAGNASDLRASTVIREVIQSGRVPQLNVDTGRIETTGFAIPDYWPAGHHSPRELMEPVNAFHDWDLGVDVDRRVYFRAPAERASVEIGAWSGAEFTDASAGSGEDVFSTVIVQATDAAGAPVEVVRTAATAAPELATRVAIDGSFTNPSFETDLSGWTITASHPASRSTSEAHHGTASLRFPGDDGGTWRAEAEISGLAVGLTYRVSVWVLADPAGGANWTVTGRVSDAHRRDLATPVTIFPFPTGSWEQLEFVFVASGDGPTSLILDTQRISNLADAHPLYVDDARTERIEVNTVDRHGFARAQRLPVQAALTTAAAEVLGDTWLRNHLRTPLKGSVTVTAEGGVREAAGGAPMHPAHLLLRTGEVLRHTGMANPDTGAWGRDGRIASVNYSAGQATVELDNERHRLDALLARYAALAGQVPG